MATLKQEQELRNLANMIHFKLNQIYGQNMGFFLNVAEMGERKGITDFIGNVDHECSIKWMKETIEIFSKNETIGACEGSC